MNQEAIEHKQLLDAIEATGEDAPCSNYPDAFFTETQGGELLTQNIAISLCNSCEVKNLCAEYGTRWELTYGIWGGLKPYQRRQLRKTRMAAGEEFPNLAVENAAGWTRRVTPLDALVDDETLERDLFAS